MTLARALTIDFNALVFRNPQPQEHSRHLQRFRIRGRGGLRGEFGRAADALVAGLRTAQQSSGIGAWNRDTEHIEKAFVFAGMNARNGVTSALVVHAGFDGIDDIFSGVDNYFDAYA